MECFRGESDDRKRLLSLALSLIEHDDEDDIETYLLINSLLNSSNHDLALIINLQSTLKNRLSFLGLKQNRLL